MSNLGFYQDVTTWIKVAGGPGRAKAALLGAGTALFFAGGAGHAGYAKVAPRAKGWIRRIGQPDVLAGNTYTVHTAAVDDQGLAFSVDDTFAVVERDADAVIIALSSSTDNPWAVSAELLAKISDFPAASDFPGTKA